MLRSSVVSTVALTIGFVMLLSPSIPLSLAQNTAAQKAVRSKAEADRAKESAAAAKAEAQQKAAAAEAARKSAKKPPDSEQLDQSTDSAAIEASIAAFEKAYNDRDAKAVAALFTAEAQIVNEDGETVQGREKIESTFAELFKAQPTAVITIEVSDLRFVGTNLAIESGRTSLIPSDDEPAIVSEYTVVHIKNREGKWLMGLARDVPAETRDHTENLLPLAFLIGDWVDESPAGIVETQYEWAEGEKYILGKFKIKLAGQPLMEGSQRIGWDPQARKIRSWVFDSDGGFQQGAWTRQGNQWMVKYQGVNAGGELTSSTNSLTVISDERFGWQSRDRIVGDEILADSQELVVVRKAPHPEVDVEHTPSTNR